MLNTWEKDTLIEIKARVKAGQHVSAREKQLVLDLIKREGEVVPKGIVQRAKNSGFDVAGIRTK